jgi:hypothetical protein
MIRPALFRVLLLTVLSLASFSACEDTAPLQGHYRALPPLEKQADPMELVLHLNGQGSWSRGDERVLFKWETKDKQIWLHTKSGGIVNGRLTEAKGIELMIPGTGVVPFKRVQK